MPRASTPSDTGRGRPVEPTIMSRKDLRKRGSGRRRTWWFVLAGVIVVGAGVAAAILLTRNSASSTSPSSGPTCPLTGEAAPGGVVPARPALAVKVGNYWVIGLRRGSTKQTWSSKSRSKEPSPDWSRYPVSAPALVGDVRSAREPDVGILSQLSDPMFAHAGGSTRCCPC